MKTLSRLAIGLIVASMLFGVTACASGDKVATVNGEAITRAEFDNIFEMAKAQNPTAFAGSEDSTLIVEYKKSLLQTLIENELIRQASLEEGAEVTDTEIDEQIDAIISSFGDEATFNTALEDAGMTMDDLRDNVRDQLLYEYLYNKVAPAVTVTDEQVEAYYEDNQDLYVTEGQSLLSHILFDLEDKETAEQVLAEIKAGGDFAALAEEYSIDPGSAANGGSLDWAPLSTWVTEFADAAAALEVGEVSELVESQFGWHIILKVDEDEGGQQSLEDVADSIRSLLVEEGRSTAFAAYMDDYMAKADIEILDDSLKSDDE